MDFLKSAVASAISKGSALPYSFGDRVDQGESIWTLHNGTKREDGSSCSIFTFEIAPNRSRLPLARNALRKLRTLRHPGVLKVLDTVETETQIFIVTERVTPLSWKVKRRSLSEETAKWGLYSIAATVKFINEDATSVHGALRVSSIYTSESGEWKLGGFDLLSSMKEDDPVIYQYGSILPDSNRYAPPEISKGGWEVIKSNPVFAADSYNFGALIFEIFNSSFQNGQAGQTSNIPPSMHQSYKKLVNMNPKLRLSVAHFIEMGRRAGGFFDSALIRLTEDIESLGLKSNEEREEFINELDDLSDDFPEDFFKMKIMPELLKSVEFGGGGPKVLKTVLKIGTKLTDDEYSQKLTPAVVRLFANPDRAIRVCLLDNLPLMIDRLPQKVVNDKIFPQMVTGFTDIAPAVREQTVKAVLTVIGKLSDRTIDGDLLRYLAKTANDEQPGIRTNTTICLGKIARNLGKSSRAKVLVAAFSRSLRDPFVHARNASLLAFAATIDVFSEEDCATKVIPAISPALIDKEKIVRDQASKTFDAYLERIRQFASTMADTALPPQAALDASSSGGVKAAVTNGASWAGWAISSFTNKPTSTKGEIQQSTTHIVSDSSNRSSSLLRTNEKQPTRPLNTTAVSCPNVRSINRIQTEQASEQAAAEDDGFETWGDMDDQHKDPEQEEADTFFESRGSPAPTPSMTTPSVPFDDGGEPDFAGWLAAQSKAKTKKALPKGLAKSTTSIGTTNKASTLRSTTSKPIISGAGTASKPKRIVQPAKKATEIKPKPEPTAAEDDDWGNDWD
ncbi:Nuclear aminoacylation-dependent tRNA export pathway component [Ophidiomyces ophidiicola]|nr:Nuclear aminoacylation-dependent tRNA export pathway component [Ophidiomyces ophidiicola]